MGFDRPCGAQKKTQAQVSKQSEEMQKAKPFRIWLFVYPNSFGECATTKMDKLTKSVPDVFDTVYLIAYPCSKATATTSPFNVFVHHIGKFFCNTFKKKRLSIGAYGMFQINRPLAFCFRHRIPIQRSARNKVNAVNKREIVDIPQASTTFPEQAEMRRVVFSYRTESIKLSVNINRQDAGT